MKGKTRKKKVLIFVPRFPVLSETFIEREVSKLIELGNLDVTVFALEKGKNITSPETQKVTTYRKLTWKDAFLAAFFGLVKFPRVIKAFLTVAEDKSRNPIQTVFIFLKSLGYAGIFSKYEPDIIYSNFMSEPSTICLIASIILNVEFAISAHARDIFEYAELIDQKVSHAKFITVCNAYAHKELIEKSGHPNPENVHLIYHGFDFDKLLSWQVEQLPKPTKTLIFSLGRFTEKKGHKYLIEASKILKESGVKHLVYILGSRGEAYGETVSEIERQNVADTVKIISEGRGLAYDKVLSYYKIADIFAFPSIKTDSGDVDGIANTLIEAAIFKVPTIATNAGSTTDLVIDGETGIIVEQKNAGELAGAIKKLINNPDLGKTLAQKAHVKAREMFNLNENIKEIERLLM